MNFIRKGAKNRWKNQIKRTASEINDRNDFSFIDSFIKDKFIEERQSFYKISFTGQEDTNNKTE